MKNYYFKLFKQLWRDGFNKNRTCHTTTQDDIQDYMEQVKRYQDLKKKRGESTAMEIELVMKMTIKYLLKQTDM